MYDRFPVEVKDYATKLRRSKADLEACWQVVGFDPTSKGTLFVRDDTYLRLRVSECAYKVGPMDGDRNG